LRMRRVVEVARYLVGCLLQVEGGVPEVTPMNLFPVT
jgi:hypothetical protein